MTPSLRVVLALCVVGCAGPGDGLAPSFAVTGHPRMALTDLDSTYYGFPGGLFPGDSIHALHNTAGLKAARAITRRNRNGVPSPLGKIVFMSVGYSNATQEWCTQTKPSGVTCNGWSFMGQAQATPSVRPLSQGLQMFNAARPSQTTDTWDSPSDYNYTRTDSLLAARGLAPGQVQAVWMKVAHLRPSVSLPDPNADAFTLARDIGNALRALKVRYPNLRQVFLASRTYGGYAATLLNPEPYAYETGFAVQWVIAAQIRQEETGNVDPRIGDLSALVAPWVDWAAYLWADGLNPRADGLRWLRTDFEADGTHPSTAGEAKVAALTLTYFLASPYSCWFRGTGTCP